MIIGALVFAAFVSGAIIATAALRPKKDDYRENKYRNHSQYPTSHDTVNAAPLIAIAEEIQKYRQDTYSNEYDKRYRDVITIGGIGLYTILTGIIAGFAWYQSWIAKESEVAANRAYISSAAFQMINYGGKAPTRTNHIAWYLAPIIENTGNTSTRFLKLKSVIDGIGRGWSFESTTTLNPAKDNVLSPHSFIIGPAYGFTGESINSIRNMGVISSGIARYSDIYVYPHYFEYCYAFVFNNIVDWEGYPPGQAIRIPGITFVDKCATHNCEDDECGPDWRERANAMK